jgi:exosortase/archaeosortase family protein
MYRSSVRRGVFILISIIVPIIANGFRGIGIVYLGYLLGSAQAAAADHIIYGWLFFSAVILILIALGLPFRQDQLSIRSASSVPDVKPPAVSSRGVFALAVGVAVIAALSPAIAAGLTALAAVPTITPAQIEIGGGCLVQPLVPLGAPAMRSQRVLCGTVPVEVSWIAFSSRSTAGPVMMARRRMVANALTEGLQENWLQTSDGTPNAWRVMISNDPPYAVAVAVWVDGRLVRPGLAMRLRMALNSVAGSAYDPIVVTVTPVVNWGTRNGAELKAAEDALPQFLLTHPELDQTVARLSARR